MTVSRPALVVALSLGALGGLWLASYGTSRAQEGRPPRPAHVADALLQPARLPFGQGASLEDVAAYLRNELKANVVLDLAALDRLGRKPTDRVRLDLDGVRLKTGLKLLLDQVGMTTKVIPEDNLLILTDHTSAEDPVDRVLEQIQAIHRELHDVQDDVREIRDILTAPAEDEPVARARNPTIIEEMPGEHEPGKEKPKDDEKKDRPGRSRPGV